MLIVSQVNHKKLFAEKNFWSPTALFPAAFKAQGVSSPYNFSFLWSFSFIWIPYGIDIIHMESICIHMEARMDLYTLPYVRVYGSLFKFKDTMVCNFVLFFQRHDRQSQWAPSHSRKLGWVYLQQKRQLFPPVHILFLNTRNGMPISGVTYESIWWVREIA